MTRGITFLVWQVLEEDDELVKRHLLKVFATLDESGRGVVTPAAVESVLVSFGLAAEGMEEAQAIVEENWHTPSMMKSAAEVGWTGANAPIVRSYRLSPRASPMRCYENSRKRRMSPCASGNRTSPSTASSGRSGSRCSGRGPNDEGDEKKARRDASMTVV